MADRDVERTDAIASPEHGSDRLTVKQQTRPLTPSRTGLDVLSNEARLGAPDARPVQEHPQVSGETEPPRVGDPLSVKEPKIGACAKAADRAQEEGTFPE